MTDLQYQNYQVKIMEGRQTQSQILEQYINEREAEALKHKQDFLKKQIFDYYSKQTKSIDDFAQYFASCRNKRQSRIDQQEDLTNMPFEELQAIVAEFKIQNLLINVEKQQESQIFSRHSIKESYQVSPQFEAQKVVYANSAWDYKISGYQESKQGFPYFAAKANQTAVVNFSRNQLIKKGGFIFGLGSTTQLWVEIKNNLLQETPSRRVQDFIILRELLVKNFPFTFVPSLKITNSDLSKLDQTQIKKKVLRQCDRFINFVCKDQTLLFSRFTFRFLKELKHSNWLSTAQRAKKKENVQKLSDIQSVNGFTQIELSVQNQNTKQSVYKNSQLFKDTWHKISTLNQRITDRLNQVFDDLNESSLQLQKLRANFRQFNDVQSKQSLYFLNLIECYSSMYNTCASNIERYNQMIRITQINIGSQAKNMWKQFNQYANQIKSKCLVYQQKRKNQINILQDLQNDKQKLQIVWMQTHSKWQAYMNKQFVLSFDKLFNSDIDILKRVVALNWERIINTNRQNQINIIEKIANLKLVNDS